MLQPKKGLTEVERLRVSEDWAGTPSHWQPEALHERCF